jgi:hypothetical protein
LNINDVSLAEMRKSDLQVAEPSAFEVETPPVKLKIHNFLDT